MHSFGFQYAFEKKIEGDLRHFYAKCFGAATSVIRIMIETLAPSSFMLYSPDGESLQQLLVRVFRSLTSGSLLDRSLRLHLLRIGLLAQGKYPVNHV